MMIQKMKIDEDGNAGPSVTYPRQVGNLPLNGSVMLDRRPCKSAHVIENGRKIEITATGIFTNKKYTGLFSRNPDVDSFGTEPATMVTPC